MTERQPFLAIRPESVQAAAAAVVAALQPGMDADWSVRAGDLEWSVDRTIAHMTGTPAKYALYLSSRSTRYVAVRAGWPEADANRQERLEAIEACGAALAGVAATAPKDAVGFHVTGMQSTGAFAGASGPGAAQISFAATTSRYKTGPKKGQCNPNSQPIAKTAAASFLASAVLTTG